MRVTAQSQANSGPDCWGQSYTYDRYANLPGIAVTKCTALILNLSINPNNNRVLNTGFAHDPAGSVTADGTFTYTWNAEGRSRLRCCFNATTMFGFYLAILLSPAWIHWNR